MLLRSQVAAMRLLGPLRPYQTQVVRLSRYAAHAARLSSTSASLSKTTSKKSWTGRTVFLGCLKVTTIFIFSFFCLVVAPAHLFAEAEPPGVAAGVILSGIIPMVTVAYITSPFVNYIHLRVPPFARNSRDLLLRYSKSPPKDAELDITTMNFVGKPRVARVKVADLHASKQRFGFVNYTRDTKEVDGKRPWWMGRAAARFGVHGGRTRIAGGEVWENIANSIAKHRSS